MNMSKRDKKNIVIFLIVLLVVAIGIQCFAFFSIAQEKRENRERDARSYGQSLSNSIKLTLEKSVDSSESLKHVYAVYGEDCFDKFNEIAQQIMECNPAISSVYIAPKGVIQYAYPEEINESTIGFRMLEDKEQGPRARLAVETQKITVAGPHSLIEGGKGLIIRNPLFQNGEFVGFTIVVLDWDCFVEQVLENTSDSSNKYRFAVWKKDHDETAIHDPDGYILRNTKDSISKKIDIEFEVPNDTWHLVVEPVAGWKVYGEMKDQIVASALIFIALIIMTMVLYIMEIKRNTLIQQVRESQEREKYTARLTEALKEAEEANAAKTNFLNNMSHDIRTPMNAILGFTELMEKKLDDPQQLQEYLRKIEVSGEYLLTLINNMLEVARIDSGKEAVDEEFMDLMDDRFSVISLLEDDIVRKNIHFTRNMNIQHRYIFADSQKTMEITINLLSNAVKYTPEGGSIHMQFDEIPCDKEGYASYVCMVKDTGIGMSEDFKEHIFESFSRERNTTEGKVLGTGLGMSIVKKLVDLMDGQIEVESELGKGSCFKVTLTHRIVENPETYLQEQQEAIQAQDINLEGISVLLAEDNELNAEITMTILEEMGARVDIAKDGVECVNMVSDQNGLLYDLILMDVQMPNLNGYEASRRIRQLSDSSKANIPILALTANAFEEDKKNALEAGMNGHLGKPIEIPKFMDALREILDLRQQKDKTYKKASINYIEKIFHQMKKNPLLSIMPGGFFAYEATGDERLIYANEAACQIWGCQSFEEMEEFCKGSFKGMVHPDDYDRIEDSIWNQIGEGQNGNDRVVYRILRKDGKVAWVDDYGHLEKNEEFGDIFYVFVADTTEKYYTE